MNPRAINSATIIQFGFSAVFNLELRQLIFNIAGLTLFKAGGSAAVAGIQFEVRDPAQVLVSKLDWTRPMDILPNVGNNFILPLTSGIAGSGYYTITGAIKDSDGQIYSLVLPPKQVCLPDGWDTDNVPGSFELKADCVTPFIRVTENTVFAYQGLSPVSKTKTGMLYYPQGTLNALPFSFTPFQNNQVYTGLYTIRNKTVARYHLGDNVYVDVAYKTTLEKKVTCLSVVEDLVCCIQEIDAEISLYCNEQRGKVARDKKAKAALPLFSALIKERGGMDASADIEEVKKILGCDCNTKPKFIEPAPVGGAGQNFIFAGDCNTDATPVTVGNTTTVTIKKKDTSVQMADPTDTIFSFAHTTDNCNNIYAFSYDIDLLAAAVVESIGLSDELQNTLNTIINNANQLLDLSGLDGHGIIDLTQCTYVLTTNVPTGNVVVAQSILIDGVTYNFPPNTVLVNSLVVIAFLNSLNKGAFNVSATAVTGGTQVVVTTQNNPHVIAVLNVFNQTQNKNEAIRFTGTCASIKNILQAIFDYLDSLNTTQIKLFTPQDVALFDSADLPKSQSFAADGLLASVLTRMNLTLAQLVAKMKDAITITCDKIKASFKASTVLWKHDTDFILGTKDGICARITDDDVVNLVFARIRDDVPTRNAFCALVGQCGIGSTGGGGIIVPDITEIVALPGLANINITAVGWSSLPPGNQTVTVLLRQCPAGGSTPAYETIQSAAVVLPNGNFQVPVNISVLLSNACYEVFIKNNAGGIGKTKQFGTLAGGGSSFVTFANDVNTNMMNSVKVDNVEQLSGPVAPGANVPIDWTGFAGAAHDIKIGEGGTLVNGDWVHWQVVRAGSIFNSGYVQYTGVATLMGHLLLQGGDTFRIRKADSHLDMTQYSDQGAVISGVCSLAPYTVGRSAQATADAVATGDHVRVTVQWTASNGCSLASTVDFAPTDSSAQNNLNLNCNGTPCASVEGVATNVVKI